MTLEETLSHYAKGLWTAADTTRATGFSERAQRELAKIGILKPFPQAKTKQRLFSTNTLKRASLIYPLTDGRASIWPWPARSSWPT